MASEEARAGVQEGARARVPDGVGRTDLEEVEVAAGGPVPDEEVTVEEELSPHVAHLVLRLHHEERARLVWTKEGGRGARRGRRGRLSPGGAAVAATVPPLHSTCRGAGS